MSGICGWLGYGEGEPTIVAMAERFVWAGSDAPERRLGEAWGLAACGPAISVAIVDDGALHAAVHGHPAWRDGKGGLCALSDFARELLEQYRRTGSQVLEKVAGDFSLAIIDEQRHSASLAVDRFGVRNLVYQADRRGLIFGATSDVVRAHPHARSTLCEQALYDYVYFHMVPGPRTMFREQRRLPAAHELHFEDGHEILRRYWQPRFEEGVRGGVADFEPAFRSALEAGVRAYLSPKGGCFLSGGTDSTTVAGTVGAVSGRPPETYSIGFAEAGYDELEYARIAARHFRARPHEYYVSPDDVVAAIPRVADAYDQPFGNASAIPTYYCARLAQRDGIERMLGGDGGDELFGGNERYAKQQRLANYQRIPATLRTALLEPMLLGDGIAQHIPLLRKLRSYVDQARLSMPARYDSYNLLERLGPERVFSREFLELIDRQQPHEQMAQAYGSSTAGSLINRMLALDFKFTLADSDLPKVTRMCDLAGVDVAFPLLHDSIVDFSLMLPPGLKLRGTRLRYFFKEALKDFLPHEIISKQKHGFGLPAGQWLRDHPPLRQLGHDALHRLSLRGIFRSEMLDDLMAARLRDYPSYFGTLVWVLMMLELWFERHAQP